MALCTQTGEARNDHSTGSRRCTKPMTSSREGVFVLMIITLASMTITLHLSHHLTWLVRVQPTPDDSDGNSIGQVPQTLSRDVQDGERRHDGQHGGLSSTTTFSSVGSRAALTSREKYAQLVGVLQKVRMNRKWRDVFIVHSFYTSQQAHKHIHSLTGLIRRTQDGYFCLLLSFWLNLFFIPI